MLAYIQHSIAIRPLPLTAAPRGELYLCLTLRSRPLPLARDPCPCLCGPGTLKGKQTHNGVVRKVQSTCCPCTPIIIDTSGNGFVLTSAASGVKFDMSGRGYPVQIAWTAPGSTNAFLALPAADGLIHSGLQLFGNYSPQPPSSTPNGFAALAVYDDPKNGGNGDGIIDSGDAIFSYLRLWIDTNHDGVSQPNEIYTLPSLGVYSISLTYKADLRTDQYGNVFRYRAQINPNGPTDTGRWAYDVFLAVQTGTTTRTAKKE